MQNILNRIVKFSLYSLVFLLPLFWLGFSWEVYEFNKQYLLFFLVSLGFLAWLAKMIVYDKEIKIRRTALDIPVLLFTLAGVLSAVFSVDKVSSIFGFYARFSNGLIGLVSLGVLYFLITNNVRAKAQKEDEKETDRGRASIASVGGAIKVFLWSCFFVILISYLSVFGIWAKLQNLVGLRIQFPQFMLQPSFNPISGSAGGLALFLSVVVILLVGLFLCRKPEVEQKNERKKDKNKGRNGNMLKSAGYLFLIASAGLLMVIIDFAAAWIVLLASLVLLVGFALWKRIFKEDVNKLLLPIFLIVLAIVFLAINPFKGPQGWNVAQNIPLEVTLDQGNSWFISLKTITGDIGQTFFGSGIGTFHYDFSKYKNVDFNSSIFWQIRFDRPSSYLAEITATMGLLGVLSYLLLIGLFLKKSWTIFGLKAGSKDKSELKRELPFLAVIIALLASQLVYYQNTSLAFAFWLFLGLLAVSWSARDGELKEKVFSFKDFPELSLIFSSLLIVLGLAIFATYYFGARFYLADVNYRTAITQNKIENLEKAARLNPYQPQYKIILARFYLEQAVQESRKPSTQQDQVVLSRHVYNAIIYLKGGEVDRATVRGACELSPNLVSAWEATGITYREIQGVAQGAKDWAIKSFGRAIELEPANPVLYTELGKLVGADDLGKAKENFAKAKELKSDYMDVLIQEALVAEREENLDEAIQKMEGLASDYPNNVDILFQFGRFYFNNGQVDEAIVKFEQIINLMPNHSNALYALGTAYQRKGMEEEALGAFEKVLELNPGNQDVIQKIEDLNRPALAPEEESGEE